MRELRRIKLLKLRRELTEVGTAGKKGGGAGERAFEVSKSGDIRVGLVGFSSLRKSTLLTKLTGTFSLAAGYEFTTLTAIPGTMHYRGAKIQILDLPGIIEGAKRWKRKRSPSYCFSIYMQRNSNCIGRFKVVNPQKHY